MSSRPSIVLSFAASDPTGGAGLQADVLTLAALGCHPVTVLTGYTVQDTTGVESFAALESTAVASQAKRLLADVSVAAIKIGVTASAANCAAIADLIDSHPRVPVVLDTVFASGRGDALADDPVVGATRRLLLPRATVATPNSLEARRLAEAAPDASIEDCAMQILDWGVGHVLVTGTHEAGEEVVNRLYGSEGLVREDRWTRLAGEYHGSGCTLASAIAAMLANNLSVEDAVREAQEYTWRALEAGFQAGGGQCLPDRLFWARGLTNERG